MLAPLHLRLANVRRFLDARIINGGHGEFRNPKDYNRLLTTIKRQKLPVNIRFDGHAYAIVLMEKVGKNINTNPFYVLEANIKDAVKAIATAQKMGVPDELISFSDT